MQETPLVSILMTAYNREKYIAEAIESVLASTYTNFELIIVDDCSNDTTVEIAKSYELNDKRIKVYINEKNLGDYLNRNRAASYATGKFLKYLDSDDLVYPYGLEAYVNSMEKLPDAALGVSSRNIQQNIPFPIFITKEDAIRTHFFKDGFLDCGPSGVIIKRNVFEKLGGFSGKRMIGDSELWFKIASQYPVAIVPPSLIFWRQHDEQEFFSGINSGIYLEMNLPMVNEFLDTPYCNLSLKEKESIKKHLRKISSRALLSMAIKHGKFKKARQVKKHLKLEWSDFLKVLFKMNKKLI